MLEPLEMQPAPLSHGLNLGPIAGLDELISTSCVIVREWKNLTLCGSKDRHFRIYNGKNRQIYSTSRIDKICQCEVTLPLLNNAGEAVLDFVKPISCHCRCRCPPTCCRCCPRQSLYVTKSNQKLASAYRYSCGCCENLSTRYDILDSNKETVLELRPCFKWISGMPSHLDIFYPATNESIGRVEGSWKGIPLLAVIEVAINFPLDLEVSMKLGVIIAALAEYRAL